MTSTVNEIAERTSDAYSFDRYGETGWRGAIRVLRSHRLEDVEIEAFLRSKHMRWAADMDRDYGKRNYGRHNGQTVSEYITRNEWVICKDELVELVVGTFGSY